MPRSPPPPVRRRSPGIRIKDPRQGAIERCGDPITHSRRTGNKTRITVSSAQDKVRAPGLIQNSINRTARSACPTRGRQDYEYPDYGRPRSRGYSNDSRPRRPPPPPGDLDDTSDDPYPERSRRESIGSDGFSDADDDSAFKFDFERPNSPGFRSKPSHSLDTLGVPTEFSKTGSLLPGPTTDLYLAGSRWLGSTFDSWDVSVQIIPVPASIHSQPLIKWYHLERSEPTFDEFIAVSRRVLTQIPERNLRRVEEMLRKIQKENEKQRQYGRELVPICVSDAEFRNDGMDDTEDFSACFSAFPFFSLKKLAQGRPESATPNASFHPDRPLLQAYTRTINDKRELSQVVTTVPSTPRGYSLHVSSVWCIVVNEDTIITCSKMSLKELRKDFTSEPSQPCTPLIDKIQVRVGSTRSWSFPIGEVRHWPLLLAKFSDSFSTIGDRDASAVFRHRGDIVDARTWPQILARTTKFPIELALQDGKNHTGSRLRSKLRTIEDALRPCPTHRAQVPGVSDSVDVATRDEIISNLRSIPSLNIFQRDSIASSEPLHRLADALHLSLANHPQNRARQAYDSCPEATIEKVRSAIPQDTGSARSTTSVRAPSIAGSKFERIALLAEYVFTLFWPIDCDHIMTRRFWGAIHTLLHFENVHGPGSTDMRRKSEKVAGFYDILYQRVFAMASALTTNLANSEVHLLRSFPDQFYEAWLHFLTAFVLASESMMKNAQRASWRLPMEQLFMAASKLEAGEEALINTLRRNEVEEFEVCSSKGITALMLNRLSRDVIFEAPDVAQIYSDYCQQLDAKVLENPLTRAHQASIRSLQQELEAVLKTLTEQLEVVKAFERSIHAQDDDRRLPYLPPLLESRQDAVLETCMNTLAARIDQFKALQTKTTELGEWHLGEIANDKDRQEAAIMVFTIVTIIFLPLSFVSSVLGMNTSDLRDMQSGQWLYWAISIPLTVIVIAGSLYWAGVWNDWRGWLAKMTTLTCQQLASEQPMAMASMRRGVFEKQNGEKPRRRTTYPARGAAGDHV